MSDNKVNSNCPQHIFGVIIQHESENSELIYHRHDIPKYNDSRYTSFYYCPNCGKRTADILSEEKIVQS